MKGPTLRSRLALAKEERVKQEAEFNEIDATVNPQLRSEWNTTYEKWYLDPNEPSPFAPTVEGLSRSFL